MDFNDTPEEAAFRTEARAWLDANAELRGIDDPAGNILGGEVMDDATLAAARAWQAIAACK